MESQNQNIEQFQARRNVIFLMIVCIIVFFMLLILPIGKNVSLAVPLILLFRAIWQFNMIYISIGDDYITYRPTAPLKGSVSMLFEEITSIDYQKNKVIINYKNKISNKEETVKIPLSVMEDEAKEKLLTTLHTVLKDKEQ